MAYTIRIHRPESAISLSEWQFAVERTDGVRLLVGDRQVTNPSTGEVILLPSSGGDAEIFLANQSRWVAAFHWRPRSGDVTFNATPEFSDVSGSFRTTVRTLALLLSAQLVGDDGETYD